MCPQPLEQGLAQRGLERRVKWDWISKGFVYQAEELNCILRTVGNLWRGRKMLSDARWKVDWRGQERRL